jgi:hypothetical protein
MLLIAFQKYIYLKKASTHQLEKKIFSKEKCFLNACWNLR